MDREHRFPLVDLLMQVVMMVKTLWSGSSTIRIMLMCLNQILWILIIVWIIWGGYSNIKLFNIGLSNIGSVQYFNQLSSEISRFEEGGNIVVKSTTIDEMLGNIEIGFIKMDVEGMEERALLGAKNMIRKQKPICAISIYHKQQDIWSIPAFLLSLNPNYKFYLRHYSVGVVDTILYAVWA